MKKVKRTNVLMEKKRFKMFKSKKKWLVAPLFFVGIGLGTVFETNEVKADTETTSNPMYTQAPSSGASSGQNSASGLNQSSAATETQSKTTDAGQSKVSAAVANKNSNGTSSASQASKSDTNTSQASGSVASTSQGSSALSDNKDSVNQNSSSVSLASAAKNAANASSTSATKSVANVSSENALKSIASASSASAASSAASASSASTSNANATNAQRRALMAAKAATDTSSSADVSTASEFSAAMANSAISEINVQANFVDDLPGDRQTYAYRPNLVINGNNHVIDFRRHWYEEDANANQNESLTINDLTMYGYSYWGPITIMGVLPSSGFDHSVTFNHVTYTGAQLMYGRTTKVYIKGNTTVNSVQSYISPFDNTTQQTQAGGNQQNFEVSYMEVEEGATYKGTTYTGTPVQVHFGGSFIVDKGATVDLTRTQAVGGDEDGFNALIYTDGGSVEFKQGSKVTLNSNGLQKDLFSPIYINNGSLTVDKDAVVNITGAAGNIPVRIVGNSHVNLNEGSSMTINQTGRPMPGYGVIYISDNAGFYVASGSTLTVKITDAGATSTDAIHTLNSAQLSFAQDATVNLSIDGGTGIAHILDIGNNSNINIYMPKSVLFQITNNTNAASSLFDVTGSGTLTAQYVKIIPNDGKEPFGPYKSVSYQLRGQGSSSKTAVVQGLTAAAESSGEALANDFETDSSLQFVTASDNFVTVDPVTNESTVISGKTGAGGYVTIVGIKGIPEGTLTADPYDTTKYLV
ncbi:KxYKxGKxW signal peptide domain-containing protein [Lacticaseibacillus chiayiensis]|uniref:KxYKxGKxW signal peptide domain-containing protein n=1 Tax=Lacticaseibacillus chiayiensis TaxID=2100821 RepID=UPI001026AF6F|nr:KxYKxGKxW signal peptide domain-containing protein [Lacticaseibacillus chiayiensis]RXT55090.1 hypothetical protein CHT97_12860 [Lacticaseibacillus chiayiensis]